MQRPFSQRVALKGPWGPPSLESSPDPETTFYGCLALTANGRLQLENLARTSRRLVGANYNEREWKKIRRAANDQRYRFATANRY